MKIAIKDDDNPSRNIFKTPQFWYRSPWSCCYKSLWGHGMQWDSSHRRRWLGLFCLILAYLRPSQGLSTASFTLVSQTKKMSSHVFHSLMLGHWVSSLAVKWQPWTSFDLILVPPFRKCLPGMLPLKIMSAANTSSWKNVLALHFKTIWMLSRLLPAMFLILPCWWVVWPPSHSCSMVVSTTKRMSIFTFKWGLFMLKVNHKTTALSDLESVQAWSDIFIMANRPICRLIVVHVRYFYILSIPFSNTVYRDRHLLLHQHYNWLWNQVDKVIFWLPECSKSAWSSA